MDTISCIFLFILVYKAANNASLYIRTDNYHEKYKKYLKAELDDFEKYVPVVVNLFKAAGIKEQTFTVALPIGYDLIQTANAGHFNNLSNRREDVVSATHACFERSKGVFKARALESLSPLYWIRMILYLPKQAFDYLGMNTDSLAARVIQLLYWGLTPFLIALRTEIYQYIIELL